MISAGHYFIVRSRIYYRGWVAFIIGYFFEALLTKKVKAKGLTLLVF